ncbi:amidohydrolase family protein [Marinivivus vitaminiproducens]|uniref:amidohydrolase family protein n=1 Tax=Marinivivus vitaminiproducens TaxID=3035935 RepID=UPI00279B10DE|nr:amidohydrolase family protein [Geminicoccaceae bacterium SCSIO 64248]
MTTSKGPCRIDSHQHFWRIERGDYGWMTPDMPIARDFLPDDLQPLLAEHDIGKTVLVQAAPTEAETAFLLKIARETDFVAGVVGWVDMAAAAAPERLADLARDPWLVGIRPMVQDLPDDHWLSRPDLDDTFQALIELDLRFDALVKPRHLPALLGVIERYPQLRVVVDHGAKPEIADGNIAPWAEAMTEIADHRHVVCKLSGLVTEAAPDWTGDTLAPYVDHLLDRFGPERLMFGSDWPVVTLRCDYRTWLDVVERRLAGLRPAERAAIMGGTAHRFYNL